MLLLSHILLMFLDFALFIAFVAALTVFCVFGCSPAYISLVIVLLRRSVGRSVF